MSELTELAQSLHRRSSGALAAVVGEAGSGKTRLCTELTEQLGGGEVSSTWALTDMLDGGPALGPWRYAAERLARTHRVDRPPPADEPDRWSLFRSMLEYLEAACVGPTVIVLEDLHRADDDTLAFTSYVAPVLRELPLLVVATWRIEPDETNSTKLDSLCRAARRIDVRPLEPSALAELIRASRHGDLTSDEVELVASLARGNPFVALKTAESLSAQRDGTPGGHWLPTAPLEQLGERAKRVVAALAVIEHRAHLDLLAEVAEMEPVAVAAVLDQARGLLDRTEDGIGFVHDLLGEAARASIEPAALAVLHLKVAEAIAARRGNRVVEAQHRSAAHRLGRGEPGDVLAAASAAARTLWESLAWTRSLKWFELATDLARRTDAPDRWNHALAEASAKQGCGLMDVARQLYQGILKEAPPDDLTVRADAALGAAGIWVEEQRDPLERGRMIDECRSQAERLPTDEETRIAELRVRLAAEDYYDSEGRALSTLDEAMIAVRQCDDDSALARALSIQHHCLLGPDHAERRSGVATELMVVARRSGQEFHATLGLCWLVVDQYLLGDPAAEASFAHLRSRVDALGTESLRYIADVIDVMRTMRAGRLDEAEAAAARAHERGVAVGDSDAFSYYVGQIGAIRWMQGRFTELEPAAREVIASGTLRKQDVVYPALLSVTTALQGEHGEAAAIAAELVDDGLLDRRTMSTWLTTVNILGQAAYLLDDRPLAERLYAAMTPYADLPVMPSLAVACLGPLTRVIGLACLVRGEANEATQWLERAKQQNRRLDNVPMAAHIDMDLARALSRTSDSESLARAATLAERAIERAYELGLGEVAEQWAQEEFGAFGSTTSTGSSAADPPVRRGELVKLKHGWRLTLEDRVLPLPKHRGFEYLALLLGNPSRDFTFIELSSLAGGGADDGTRPRIADYEPVLDTQARSEITARLLQIQSELEVLNPKRHPGKWRKLVDEEQRIEAALRDATIPGGRSRPLDKEATKTANRVKKAIVRALETIRDMDSAIGEELEATIESRSVGCYRPLRNFPISWRVER